MKLDSKNATVNGVVKPLDVAPISYKGRTMVPARFIAESFDADVTWDGITQTVTITSKNK